MRVNQWLQLIRLATIGVRALGAQLDKLNLGESEPALVRTWDLSGAEYYTGNSVPARYRTSGSACGVLLLWSKWI